MNTELVRQKITDLNVCIIIPTYNNERTLKRVIDSILEYSNNIIVVNDGCTDSTSQILESYSSLEKIHFQTNKGKGLALRKGFKHAIDLGYDFAITIDSDGQHFASDIPAFIKSLEANNVEDILIIGARNMKQEGVPGKSSFGNNFSNFWFKFETGIKLQDTQSGFRLYPLRVIKDMKFFTTKFEFEIEVIVKSAWSDVPVINIPIQVLYDESERVSHFRPFKDFTRISILNTWLVLLALLYYKPRQLYRNFKKKGIKRFFKEDVIGSDDSPRKKALSIALGTFIGFSPLWGFHTLLAITLAVFFKLNKTISFAFSNVSFPPFVPFVVLASLELGQLIFNEPLTYSLSEALENFEALKNIKLYVVGSFALAIIGAIVFGFSSYFILVYLKNKKRLTANG